MAEPKKCGFEGNADMYGMGIRIGYYIQWYGAILAAWTAPDESKNLRIANSLFVTATFLALVILTVRQHDPERMPVVETYIILFLTFGSYFALVPIYIWRIVTGCNPRWDPTKFPRVRVGRVYNVCNTLILITVLLFQLWFWIHQVPKLDGEKCPQYGFFFTKMKLNSKPFRALNIVPSVFLLGASLYGVGIVAWRLYRKKMSWRSQSQYAPLEQLPQDHKQTLQILESVCQFLVTTTIVIGVEWTILWNEIEKVHDIASAGQTIPLFIGLASVGMVLYVRFLKKDADATLGEAPANNQPNNTMTTQAVPTQAYQMNHFNNGYYPAPGGFGTAYYPSTAQSPAQPAPASHHPTVYDDLPGGIRGRP